MTPTKLPCWPQAEQDAAAVAAAVVQEPQQQQQQQHSGNGKQQNQQRKVGAAGPRTSHSKDMVDTSPPRGASTHSCFWQVTGSQHSQHAYKA